MKKRNTPTKQIVWEIFSKTSYALCHEDILKLTGNHIDRVTVYRILQSFSEDGLIHKIVDTSGKTYYATCKNNCCAEHHSDNHIHFKCIKCEHIVCLGQEFKPVLPKQYDLININCIAEGVCSDCK